MIRRLRLADEGFTLIELLVVVAILPIVAGAIMLGLTTTLSNKATTTTRLNDSHDAQITSAYFVRDITSAQQISTSSTASLCGVSPYLLGLRYLPQDGTTGTDSVVYSISGGTLIRTVCGGNPSTHVLAHDVFPAGGASISNTCAQGGVAQGAASCATAGGTAYAGVTVECTHGDTSCANAGLVDATPQSASANGVDYVNLGILEYDSTLAQNGNQPFTFHVTASPQGWSAAANGQPGGTPSVPALDLIGPNSTASFQGSSSCSLNVNGIAAVNNSSSGSVSLGNNNDFTATEVYSQSSDPVSGGSSPPVVVGPPTADPYGASLTPPDPTDPTVHVKTGNWTASGQLDGVYYIKGSMSVGGDITTGPDGVLLYLAPTSTGSIDLTGNSSLTLSRSVGAYSPVVIWAANGANLPAGTSNISLGGNGNVTAIGGTIYDPQGKIALDGGGNSGGVNAAGIVAKSLSCQGGGNGVGFGAGPLTTRTVVTANPSPATDGQTVDLAAQVQYKDPNSGNWVNVPNGAGNVAFQVIDNNNTTTTNCVTPAAVGGNGTATCTTGALTAALSQYTINAVYQGTASYGPSTATPIKEIVVEPTTTKLSGGASGLVSGNTTTFTATVTAPDGTSPQGNVTFGGGITCTGTGGNVKQLPTPGPEVVSCTTEALMAGAYNVTATYTDTSNPQQWNTSNDSTSMTVAAAPTTTTVVSSQPSSKPSQQVTFTATVVPTPDAGSVAWTITDKNGAVSHCAGTGYTATALVSGSATCKVTGGTLSDGNAPYTVAAVYSGDSNYLTSNGSITQNVAKVGTTTSFLSLANGPGNGNAHKWTDKVTVGANDSTTPTGAVVFYLCSGTQSGCSSTTANAQAFSGSLSGGTASSGQQTLAPGTKYCFNAVYQGTTDYASSTEPQDLASQCFTA